MSKARREALARSWALTDAFQAVRQMPNMLEGDKWADQIDVSDYNTALHALRMEITERAIIAEDAVKGLAAMRNVN